MKQKIINFIISRQNDVFVFFELTRQSCDVEKELLSFVGLKDGQITEAEVKLFVDKIYKKEENEIKKQIVIIEKDWGDKQNFFIKESETIFKNIHSFQGGVTASPSVWPFFGRFFDRHLITFPYNKGKDEAVFVIIHEYLHFIFYKYIYETFKLSPEEMASQLVWNFSEVINVVIQNQESWLRIFKIKAKVYPQHTELYANVQKDWDEGRNLDWLVKKYVVYNI